MVNIQRCARRQSWSGRHNETGQHFLWHHTGIFEQATVLFRQHWWIRTFGTDHETSELFDLFHFGLLAGSKFRGRNVFDDVIVNDLQQGRTNFCAIFHPQWILSDFACNNTAPSGRRWPVGFGCGNGGIGTFGHRILVGGNAFDDGRCAVRVVNDLFDETLIFTGYEIIVNLRKSAMRESECVNAYCTVLFFRTNQCGFRRRGFVMVIRLRICCWHGIMDDDGPKLKCIQHEFSYWTVLLRDVFTWFWTDFVANFSYKMCWYQVRKSFLVLFIICILIIIPVFFN